jgi:hypothetical protein
MAPFRIVCHAIRRVGHHQRREHIPEERLDGFGVGTVSTGHAVRAKAPDIADDRHRGLGDWRNLVLVGETLAPWVERSGQLLRREAQRRQVGAHDGQLLELEIEHLKVPAGV